MSDPAEPSKSVAPLVTVAIPFYAKHLRHIERALQSLQRQDMPSWRCVIVDDHSPQTELPELTAGFQEPRFQVVRNPTNLGIAGNWNRCIELAETDLVCLLHQDDWLEPGYLSTVVKILDEEPNAAAAFAGSRVVSFAGTSTFSFPDWYKRFSVPSKEDPFRVEGDAGLASLLRGNYIFCPSLCYRKSRIRCGWFDDSFDQVLDLEFIFRVLTDGGFFVGTHDIQYVYRRHTKSQTGVLSESGQRFREELDLYTDIAQRTKAIGWSESHVVANQKRIIKAHLIYSSLQDLLRLRFQNISAKWKILRSS